MEEKVKERHCVVQCSEVCIFFFLLLVLLLMQ